MFARNHFQATKMQITWCFHGCVIRLGGLTFKRRDQESKTVKRCQPQSIKTFQYISILTALVTWAHPLYRTKVLGQCSFSIWEGEQLSVYIHMWVCVEGLRMCDAWKHYRWKSTATTCLWCLQLSVCLSASDSNLCIRRCSKPPTSKHQTEECLLEE